MLRSRSTEGRQHKDDDLSTRCVLCTLPGLPTRRTLFKRDGITLEGTAGIVTREAGVCRVLEDHHSAEVHERMKANYGQPLHVWRLDFAARNRSGRRLEHLTAHFKIASEWPPCTNWTGPEGTYPETPQWAGSFEVLQRPSGMEPGDQVTDTVFVLAFHSHRAEV